MTPGRKEVILASEPAIVEYLKALRDYRLAKIAMEESIEKINPRLFQAWSNQCITGTILTFCAKDRGGPYIEEWEGYASILDDERSDGGWH